jgi:hypothetical protein
MTTLTWESTFGGYNLKAVECPEVTIQRVDHQRGPQDTRFLVYHYVPFSGGYKCQVASKRTLRGAKRVALNLAKQIASEGAR